MPYKDPTSPEARESQRRANRRFRELHPEIVQESRNEWYRKHREDQIQRKKKWELANPERVLESHLRRKFGLTKEQYDAMLEEQQGLCAICHGPVVGRRRKRFDVDHNHSTKKVRGLLCHPCNVMVGQARDNPGTLEAAAEYLRRTDHV